MKKIICVLLVLSVLFICAACGAEVEKVTSEENNTTTKELENNQFVDNEVDYHAMDLSNNIYMYMYGDEYRCAKNGNVWDFNDGKTLITYSKLPTFIESNQTKDIEAFYDYIPTFFTYTMATNEKKFDFKKQEDKTINGLDVRTFAGTIIDDNGKSHTSKAYTFNYNSQDLIVIAVSMENNKEMKDKMEKDLDYFMTHLKFGE